MTDAAVASNGNIAYFGTAQDRDHAGAFLSFQGADQIEPSTFIRTYPFGVRAIAPLPDGRFLVLFLQVTDTHGEDYPAVRVFDANGTLQETLLTTSQLHLPSGVTGVSTWGSSNPAIAAAGNSLFLYIPRLDTIQQWTLKGDFVRSIPVELPGGAKHSGVIGLSVTSTLRIALTAYQYTGEGPKNSEMRRRVIFTDNGQDWHDLLPAEKRNHMLRGTSGGELVVQVEDRLLWIR